MVKLIQDVQPRGMSSAYVVAPFDKGKKQLESEDYHIVSLEENARLRIQEGKNADVSRNGNWVKEGFLYVPGKGKFLTKTSPVIAHPVDATNAHRNGNDFYLTAEQVEQSLAGSVKLKDKDFSVPVKRFGENELTVYAFGDSAQDYGKFLENAGIKEMPVWMVDNIGDKPFVRQAWLYRLDGRSGLLGDYWYLSDVYRVRGVREDALASEPKKNAEDSQQILYSSADLEMLKEVRTGNVAPKELEKILARFQ